MPHRVHPHTSVESVQRAVRHIPGTLPSIEAGTSVETLAAVLQTESLLGIDTSWFRHLVAEQVQRDEKVKRVLRKAIGLSSSEKAQRDFETAAAKRCEGVREQAVSSLAQAVLLEKAMILVSRATTLSVPIRAPSFNTKSSQQFANYLPLTTRCSNLCCSCRRSATSLPRTSALTANVTCGRCSSTTRSDLRLRTNSVKSSREPMAFRPTLTLASSGPASHHHIVAAYAN